MKQLNQRATKIMSLLVSNAQENGGYIKINKNGEKPIFMPVSVQILEETENYRKISVAHYYEQNGDLMADPEMCFYEYKKEFTVFLPYYFKQDGILALEQDSIYFENGQPSRYNKKLQADHTLFANMWMDNIKYQQEL